PPAGSTGGAIGERIAWTLPVRGRSSRRTPGRIASAVHNGNGVRPDGPENPPEARWPNAGDTPANARSGRRRESRSTGRQAGRTGCGRVGDTASPKHEPSPKNQAPLA